MINKLKTSTALIAMLLFSFAGMAQPTQTIEMADGLYQSGKIYVVIIVVAIIFVGIVGYLISLDRKISRLEKELKNK